MIVAHDLLATVAALLATFLLRFEGRELAERLDPWLLTGIVIYAGVVYFILGLHGPKWRFTSLLEFSRIVRAAAVLSISLLVLDYIILSPNFYGSFFFGKITIILYFVIQTVFLSGLRIAYRYLHDTRTQRTARKDSASPTLILGRAADVDVSLRAIENGAIRKIWPVGLLSPADSDQRVTMRGVPVMGRFDDLENVISSFRERNIIVSRLILTASAFEPGAGAERILTDARRLGLVASRMPSLEEAGAALRLAPVAVEDLLVRPSVKIDQEIGWKVSPARNDKSERFVLFGPVNRLGESEAGEPCAPVCGNFEGDFGIAATDQDVRDRLIDAHAAGDGGQMCLAFGLCNLDKVVVCQGHGFFENRARDFNIVIMR